MRRQTIKKSREVVDLKLVYDSDKTSLIERLKNEKGFTNEKIINILCRGSLHEDVKKYARGWAPLLGISELKFLQIAFPIRKRH